MKKQAKERTNVNEREPHIAGSDRRPFRAGRSAKVNYADDYGKQASEGQAARSGTGDASPVWQRSVKVHHLPWAKKIPPAAPAKWGEMVEHHAALSQGSRLPSALTQQACPQTK